MATVTTIPAPPEIKPPTNNALSNLEKIENFINEPIYKEILENAVNFNTRLCIERRLRLPFIDTQTGVAQNHSSLFMAKRQRLPGLNPGQIYSYPRQRWRKKRRQYLTMNARAYARHVELLDGETDMHSISQIENPALQDTDSKDSQLLPGEVSKEWFYDEQDMLEMETFDEPDPDSDLDYEESYTKRRRGRKGTGRVMYNSAVYTPSTPGRKRGAGRGRGKKTGPGGHNYDPTPGDPDKPFACELCGARYKTRPGLTYHYGHSHKEGASDENSRESAAPSPMNAVVNSTAGLPGVPPNPVPGPPGPPAGGATDGHISPGPGPNPGQVYQDSYVSFLNQSPGTPRRSGSRQPGAPPAGPLIPQPPLPPHPLTGPNQAPPTLPPNLPAQPLTNPMGDDPPMPILQPEKVIEIPLVNVMPPQEPIAPGPSILPPMVADRKVPPSPYCDFCLGDSTQNKKTGGVEELVSCHDCGRSGKGSSSFASGSYGPESGATPFYEGPLNMATPMKSEEKIKRGRKKKLLL
ncbi:hypothetical protein HUJ05_008790 [Dendroctonus ponderosae]|nr:hypothetical protein HUJ05_008790 [Dendroctonus ponderosae]KAH1008216.1 hypothetical protein HUJ05_008790 [Dendroctonus ponderosae]